MKNPAATLTAIALAFASVSMGVKPSGALAAPSPLPGGGRVIAGSAKIDTLSNRQLMIRQNSSRAIIDWRDFSIGSGATVKFLQPAQDAAILNRVTGNQMSSLDGSLLSNGRVYLINPNGVLIGPSGRIDAGGFVASTLDVSNLQFMGSGDLLLFGGDSDAEVTNRGLIQTPLGDVVLIGRTVRNEGTIEAPAGQVALAAGQQVELRRMGDDARLSVRVLGGKGLAENTGLIEAAAVDMRAAGGNPYALAINHEGVIRATDVKHEGGRVLLTAGSGVAQIAGEIDASATASNASGGDITVLADQIALTDHAHIRASGPNGGGQVRIGTDAPLFALHTSDEFDNARRADAVVMSSGASIDASATAFGNGGSVMLWSDRYTNFQGSITARGGASGGHGGFVETSSANNLQAIGHVDAGAPAGLPGQWLLDPYDVTITNATAGGSFSGASPNVFAPTSNSATVDVATIESSLNGGTSVTINTGASGAQNGDLSVTSSIAKTAGGAATLWLGAARNISIGTGVSITSTTSTLDLVLQADSDGNSTGGISTTGTVNINTNGGAVTMSGGNLTLANLRSSGYAFSNVADVPGISLSSGTSISTGAGGVWVRGQATGSGAGAYNGVSLSGGSISTTTGAINIVGIGGSGSVGSSSGIDISGGSITAAGGAITITGTANATAATSNGFAGMKLAGSVNNSAAGTITLTGTGGALGGGAANYGINLTNSAAIQSSGSGAMVFTATPGGGSSAIYVDGSGTANIGLGNLSGAYTGAITLNANSIDFTKTTAIRSNGALVIQPTTVSTTIGIGTGASGTLNLDGTELGYLQNGFSSITFGLATGTGAVDVRSYTFSDALTVRSSGAGGSIAVNGSLATGSAAGNTGAITLTAPGSITTTGTIAAVAQAITLTSDTMSLGAAISSTGAITIAPSTAGTTIGLGNSATGTLNLTSTELGYLTNGFSSITIGHATGTGAIDFTGYTFNDPISIRSPSGAGTISLSGPLATGSAAGTTGTITLAAGTSINTGATGTINAAAAAVSLTADSLSIGSSITSTGALTLTPTAAATTIGLGNSASGTFNLDNSELGYLTNGFSSITIGHASGTGAVDFRGYTFNDPIVIRSPSGAGTITLSGPLATGSAVGTTGTISLSGATSITTGATSTISAGAAAITLTTNSISLGATVSSTGALTIAPPSAAVSIGLGNSAAGTLNLDNTELGYLANGFSAITIGHASGTAAVDIRAYTFSDPITIRSPAAGGTITVNGALATGTAAGTTGAITLQAMNSITTVASINAGSQALTLSTNSLSLGGNISSTGALVIQPISTTTSMGIGTSATGALNLDNTELGYIQSGFSAITMGLATSTAGVEYRGYAFPNNATILAGSGTLTVNSDTFNFTAPTLTLTGTGPLIIQPVTASTTIGIGNSSTGALNFTTTEISRFTNGFSGITIGSATGSGDIDVRAITFTDPLTLRTASGAVAINGTLTLSGAGDAITIGGGSMTGGLTVSSGITTNNGNISLQTSSSSFVVNGVINSGGGVGGTLLTASGIALNSTPVLGGGNISLLGGSQDTTINSPITQSTNYALSAVRDIIINSALTTTGSASGTLTADSDNDGVGGVQIATAGSIVSAGGVSIYGADLFATATVGDAIVIQADGSNNQIQAAGDITLGMTAGAASTADIDVSGKITSTAGAINITANDGLLVDAKLTAATTVALTASGSTGMRITKSASIDPTDVTLTADVIDISGSITGTGVLTIQPVAEATTIGIGPGATGTLNLDESELTNLDKTFSTIVIGSTSGSGEIDVRASNWPTNLTLQSNSGAIGVNGDLSTGLNNLTLQTSGRVTQTASITANGLALLGRGSFVLDYAGNTVTTLAADAEDVSFYNSVGLEVGAVGSATGISSNGPVTLRTAERCDINLSQSIDSATTGDAIVIAAGRNFINGGKVALTTPGRWLIYSQTPTDNTNGDLVGTRLYNRTFEKDPPESVGGKDNLLIYALAPTLTITAVDQSKIYGAGDPSLTYSVSGLVEGDAFENVITGSPSIDRQGGNDVGTYTIIPSAGNMVSTQGYGLNFVNGALTITPAPLTVTASARSKIYGASDPTLTYTASGLVNGDTNSVFTGALSRTTGQNVGTYSILRNTLSAGANYTLTYAGNDLTITPAALTITAADKNKVYGNANPSLTATYSGLVNSDTSSVVSGLTLATTATGASHVGTYPITASGASASNYTISYTSGTLTIDPATLTITADDKIKTYATANPALTATYSGFVNGDTSSVVSGLSIATTATTSSHAGTYPITPSGAVASDYTINHVNGTLTIDPAALTITADDKSKTYGNSNPALTASYSGLVNGDTSAVVSGLNIATTATSASHVGTYPITPSGASASDYTISYVNGTLTIDRASLLITADDKNKIYGDSNPAFTASFTGLLNGDTSAVVSGLSLATSATTASHVGTYSIIPSGASASDYTINYASGTLTINPATLTISADNKTKTYGDSNPALTASFNGFVNGDTSSVVSGLSIATIATASSHAGTYAIVPSGASASDYTIDYVNGTLTIDPATLTITADDKSKTYGDINPALTASYSGFVNGDTTSVVSGLNIATAALDSSHVGTYSITPSGASASDYTIHYVNGTLTIDPASLTITADDKSKNYGDANPAFTASYTGLVNGDTSAVVSGLVLSTAASASSHVGQYPIVASSASASDYTINYVNGTLTIDPATLTITADDKTRTYGSANPSFTASYSGLVNGDTSSVVTGLNISTTATTGSNVGTYPIHASGASAADYVIDYVDGALTIDRAALTITAADKSKTYGSANPTLTATYSGLVNGDASTVVTGLTIATTATGNSHVGTYPIAASGASASNYTINYINGTLTIDPATLTISADDKNKTYGSANPTLTASFSGLVNGDTSTVVNGLILTTTGTTSSHVGAYPITPSGASASDYTINYFDGTLTIDPAALTITADDQSKTYGVVNPALTASFSGLVNGDASTVVNGLILTTTGTTSSHVGAYPITPSGASANDYTINYVDGTLTVNPAALTITADDQSKTYGAVNPALTASFSGLVNGDTSSVVSGLNLATTATSASHVGTYPITLGGASASNYTIDYVNGTLTIDPATLTITADDQSKTYGHSNPALTASFSGFVNGDTSSVVSGLNIATSATGSSHVGTYPITPSGASASDYTINYVNGTLTIDPATLTITAVDKSKTYGDTNPAFTASLSGLVNGDTSSVVSGLSIATTASASSHVGTYPIIPSGASASDYTISYVNGTLTIDPATLTITADDKSKTYGNANPAFSASYVGLVNGDTSSVVSGLSIATTATGASHVGSYPITPSGASAGDYTINYVNGTLTVDPAALTIVADNKSKIYGRANPTLTASFNGLVNGDSSSVVTGLSLATTAGTGSNVGTYPITASGASASDYTISYVDGTLAIDPASLTITADNKSRTYGSVNPTFTATYSGMVNGDTSSVVSGLNLATSATTASHVGDYSITPSGATSQNYTIDYVDGTLTVDPAALTIVADDKSKTYGSVNPTLTATYSGMVNGDTSSVVSGLMIATTATTGSHVGTYSITPSGAVASDYTINYVNGTLTIDPAALTITADDKSKSYGTINPALTASYSGLVNGDTAGVVTGLKLSTSATSASNVGQYAIVPAGASASDYTIHYIDGTLTINPADLTIAADDQTKTYGANNPLFTASYTGLVNGDTPGVVDGLTLSTVASATSHVGQYAIIAGGASASNYTIHYIDGTLTINPAALTITASAQGKVYGDSDPLLTFTATGLQNGDTPSLITGQLARVTGENVGAYAIHQGNLSAGSDYMINYVGADLSITPATLSILADAKTKTYGDADPLLTYSYSGLKNGDASSVLIGSLVRDAGENVGAYAIGRGTLDAGSNYVLDFTSANFLINPATLIVRADSQTKIYGDADPMLTYHLQGLKNNDSGAIIAGTLNRAAGENVGDYAINQGTLSAGSNYTIQFTGAITTITPATLFVTADNQSKAYGRPDPALTFGYHGLKRDDTASIFTGALTRDSGQTAGTYAIRQGTLAAGPNYLLSFAGASFVITQTTPPPAPIPTPEGFVFPLLLMPTPPSAWARDFGSPMFFGESAQAQIQLNDLTAVVATETTSNPTATDLKEMDHNAPASDVGDVVDRLRDWILSVVDPNN